MSEQTTRALAAMSEKADVVKLRLWDDPLEYSEAERAQALVDLFDEMDRANAILENRK